MVTLEHSHLFAHLGLECLRTLPRIAREQSFGPGQEVFREGAPGDGLYVVKDGLVEISVLVGSVRHVFSEVRPGDFFGEMAVLEDKGRSATATARQPSIVYFIPNAEVLKLVGSSPELAMTLLREISHRLREFNHQYLREVLQAERLTVIGRFARSIVHDLKNPLNIIGLTAEMAGMARLAPELRQDATNTIRLQVDRISEMVNEILDFTQGTQSQLVLPPMDYGEFVGRAVEEVRRETALKNVTIELQNPPPSVPLLINPKRLRRVFHNLAQNATEAMSEGGHIFLRFTATPAEVVTEFEDTGPGIASEIADHLFQAFATYGKMHGTGLGLSICKRILEDHRGWIKALNQPGRGAIFAFGLPRPGVAPEATASAN
ncbi:MAG TPA: ATP-binding protein [Verrucomicrobiae bacterium]